MKEEIKCYCGHTTTCDCGPEEPKQERSYSEEEVIQLLIKFNQEIQEVEDVRGWFNQFKKK